MKYNIKKKLKDLFSFSEHGLSYSMGIKDQRAIFFEMEKNKNDIKDFVIK